MAAPPLASRPLGWVLTCLVLTACGSPARDDEIVAAYLAFRRAVAAEDAEAVKRSLTAERQAAFDETSVPLLELVAAMAPEVSAPGPVTVKGDSAMLTLEAEVDGQPVTGAAVLVREAGEWKLHEERWHLTIDLSGDFARRLTEDPEAKPSPSLSWPAHYGGVTRLAFLPDGERIVSIGINDRRVKVWARATGALLGETECPERPSDMACLSRTGEIAVVDAAGTVLVWPLENASFGEPRRLAGAAGPTARIAAAADGSLLATSGYRHPVRVWRASGGEVRELPGSTSMRGLAFSPRGASLAAGGYGNTWKLWELDPRKLSGRGREIEIPKVADGSDAWSVAWSPDGTRVLTGHMDSSITLWLAKERREVHNFYVQDAAVHSVAFAGDGTVFASGHNDGSVHLWAAETADRLARLKAHQGPVECLAFSPLEGDLLASGGDDGRIVLWQ